LVEGIDGEIAQIRAEADLSSGGSKSAVEGKVDLAALFRQREASLDVAALQARCIDDLEAAEERLKDALRNPHSSHNTALDGQAQRSSQTLLSTAAAIVSSPAEVAALHARVLSLFGESAASLDRKQGQTNQVYQFLETLTRQRDAACRPNLLEIEDLDIKRDQMQRQRSVLLQQLQALEANIGAIDARKETLQAAVAAAQSSYQQQTGACALLCPSSLFHLLSSPCILVTYLLLPFFAPPHPHPVSTNTTTQHNTLSSSEPLQRSHADLLALKACRDSSNKTTDLVRGLEEVLRDTASQALQTGGAGAAVDAYNPLTPSQHAGNAGIGLDSLASGGGRVGLSSALQQEEEAWQAQGLLKTLLPARKGAYGEALLAYVATEARCVKALAGRVG
jgi:hypothetical protein